MSSTDRAVVNHMKNQSGWIDTLTPPPGQVLNAQGYAVAATTIAPAQFIPLPPPPPPPRLHHLLLLFQVILVSYLVLLVPLLGPVVLFAVLTPDPQLELLHQLLSTVNH